MLASTNQPSDVTRLLQQCGRADAAALRKLLPIVYDELHRLAEQQFRHQEPGHTLQTTALVNEAYMRLFAGRTFRWRNRSHFFAIAAIAMRQILVNHAKQRQRDKRGGGVRPVSLDDRTIAVEPVDEAQTDGSEEIDLLSLDESLKRLAAFDARRARVVELRFFGGLNVEETAEALDVSRATIKRDWSLARAWLLRDIRRESGDEP